MKKNELPNDVTLLQQLLLQQQKTIEQLQQALTQNQQNQKQQQETIQQLQFMIDKLNHQIENLLRVLYGKKSERQTKPNESQTATEQNNNRKGTNIASTEDAPNKKNRRRPPAHLPRHKIEYDLSESEKGCSCGYKLHRIGQECTNQYEFIPPKLIVIQHIRYKYGCNSCKRTIRIPPLPSLPIEKGLPGAGLLTEVLINKYEDHLPLYRQQKRWARLGFEMPRSTLCDWIAECAFLLKPLVELMHRNMMLMARRIYTDDTEFPVQAVGKTHKGRLWVYRCGGDGSAPNYVIYDYSSSRSQKHPQKFLREYQGYLQADAYNGYDKLYEDNKIIEVACWAHARRKFYEVSVAAKGNSTAHDALIFINKLYAIEEKIKGNTSANKKIYRRYYAKPILKRFRRWLGKMKRRSIAKTPMAQAICYALNHWRALNNYLREGYLDIDNNAAERVIKPVVLGRKNYLFAGSHDGAESAAVIYSIIETCKLQGVNTYDYVRDILTRLPSQKINKLEELLPGNWKNAYIPIEIN